MTYLEQYEASKGDQDPTQRQAQLDTARNNLAAVLMDLCYPKAPTQKEDVSSIDREGDTTMKGADDQNEDTPAEVVTIPITVEDELSDIPPEMRETVAKEIAAFRERSNRECAMADDKAKRALAATLLSLWLVLSSISGMPDLVATRSACALSLF